jgi:murein DD-endopeptidase MepM/ murein hydrolase activator NlpD
MTTAHRDLSSPELWERSLERSRYRRSLLPGARRRQNRRKGIAAAMSAATVAGPASPVAFASLSGKPQADLGAETASKRAIEVREGGLPLQLGSQGPLVAQVQNALDIPADGIFGVQTYVAVRGYQARAGLHVDGIVGPATWGALFPPTSAARGGDAPPEVKQRLERELRAAGARLDERAAEPVDELFGPDERAGSGAEGSSRKPASGGDQAAEGSTGSGEPSAGGDGKASADDRQAPAEERQTPAEEPKAPAGGERQSSQPVNTSCGSSTVRPPLNGTVTSGFGPRWGRMHEGLDIAAPAGTAIHAAACGTVTIAGVQDGYGNIVCITHSSRFATCYAHMSRFAVSQGARVRAGQVIGYVGCTGNCTGPHVHFETRVNGQAQDPSPYLNGSRAASASAASRATARSGAAGGRTAAVMTTGGGATAPGTGTAGQAKWSGSGSGVGASEAVAGSGGAVAATPVTPVQPAAAPVAPAPVTPAAPVEPAPVPVTPAAPVEPAPVPVTPAAPVEPAPVPVEPVAAPVEPAPVPVEPAPVPAEPVAAPLEPAPVPAEPVAAPAEPAPVPVEPVAAPAEPAPAPAPAEPVAAPAEPVAAPAEAAPAEAAAAPAEPAPAPTADVAPSQ